MDYDANPTNPPTARFPTTYIRQSPVPIDTGDTRIAAHTPRNTYFATYFVWRTPVALWPGLLHLHRHAVVRPERVGRAPRPRVTHRVEALAGEQHIVVPVVSMKVPHPLDWRLSG